jgi:triacylglycerol esterase/lipase EstA (alpha/beta hydrolase family)
MSAPSKILFSLEGVRALYEYGLGHLLNANLVSNSPKGDGHHVLIFPGLCTNDSSTAFIRSFLNELGYKTHPWGLGRNLGPRGGMDKLLEQISARVHEVVAQANGEQISIIGWSLGGIYGREIAKLFPTMIRQVITLGTPFKGSPEENTSLSSLYEMLCKDTSHKNPDIMKRISTPPPVPFTSIYSKSDGVVHWQSSIENEGPYIENIEVSNASHLGLGHNPASVAVIADRLSQKKETWVPYKKK